MLPTDPSQARSLAESFLVQDAEHALVLLDADGLIRAWLGAAERIFGYAPQEMLGRHVAELFVPEDRARRQAQDELAAACRVGRTEDDRWHLRRDGAAIWISGSMTALRDAHGRPIGFAKVMRDRTDLRTQIETLEARAEGLSLQLQAAGLMLRTLGHELRNPLEPMLNVAALLERSDAAVDTTLPARILRRQIAVMQRLADDLMDFSRLDHGRLELRLSDFVLQELLTEIVAGYREAAAQRGVRLELVLPQSPLPLRADRERLQQVLVNLVDNALRHNGRGHQVVVRATEEPPEAVIRVEDDGAGIPPDLLPHVFELFARGSTTAAGRQGLGIGLALARRLIELHDGSIDARSAGVDRGAVFTVRLPTRVARPAPSP